MTDQEKEVIGAAIALVAKAEEVISVLGGVDILDAPDEYKMLRSAVFALKGKEFAVRNGARNTRKNLRAK